MTASVDVHAGTTELDFEDENELAEKLEVVWKDEPGFVGWMKTTDHKRIAIRFIVTAFVFLAFGGADALLMRTQLITPENGLIGPDKYNQMFTVHGANMMFMFAVPVMLAVGMYLVPLMIGARSVAFPRLNAFGYWVYLIGGSFLWISLLLNSAPDQGWFSYVPLAGSDFTPTKRGDVWVQMVTFSEAASLVLAVQIIATALKMRAPGMTASRIPVFVWAMVATSFMVVFSLSTIATASQMLGMDRLVNTRFFDVEQGGDVILWQHLFWWFGHPEVYIIFLPATGMISAVLPAVTRRPLFGHTALVLSTIATAFLGFGVWVHHMFTTGILQLSSSFFTSTSVMITIPTGVQIFCWIATIWTGRPVFNTAFLFLIGFFVTFLIGGLTGVMIASVPFDAQVHDTYFIVAHLHYVLIGGGVFPLFAAIYYWYPKWTGRMLSETMGKVNFWTLIIGVNLTFFPMHIAGLAGMPRRVYTYPEGMGWSTYNLLSTIGSYIIGVSVVLFVLNILLSGRSGRIAGKDPWFSNTLEWLTSSPAPAYNFARIPYVQSRNPLWGDRASLPIITGLSVDKREALITTAMDALPDMRHREPVPSIWPFWAAIAFAIMFIWLMFTPWAAVVGSVLLFVTFTGWAIPEHDETERGGGA